MDKRFSWVFLLASGAFFLFVVGLTGYRIDAARRVNTVAARDRSRALAAKVTSLRDSTGGYDAPLFKTGMRPVFDSEPRLLLLSLRSAEDGILYVASRSRSTMREPATITPEWRGTPSYQVNQGSEVLLSIPVQEGGTGPTMDALFVVLDRDDLYPVVRDDLYLFLAFLLVCGVLILIVMSVQYDTPPGRPEGASSAGTGGPAVAREEPAVLRKPPAPVAPVEHAEPALAQPVPARRGAAVTVAEDLPVASSSERTTSTRTGLVRGELLEPRLHRELDRAAAAREDVSVACIRIDKPFADAKLPVEHASLARLLREGFRPADMIFETGEDSCALIMPGVDVEAAVAALEGVRSKVTGAAADPRGPTVSIGVSSRGRRLVDPATLLEEADVSMTKAWREGGDQVIGFRADPALFRETRGA